MSPPKSAKKPTKKAPKKKAKTRKKAIFARRHDFSDETSPLDSYLDSFGQDSKRTMGSALESIADILSDGRVSAPKLAWHRLRHNHVTALRGRMVRIFAPATANRYLTAIRGVMKAAWRLELIDWETMEQTIDVAPARGKRAPKGRQVEANELKALFKVCSKDDNKPLGARDAALLALLYGTGMRRAEAASLSFEALDSEAGRIRVLGKGNKERDVYLPPGTLSALFAWLEYRGEAPGPLFCPVTKAHEVRQAGITAQLTYHIVKKRHLEAGIESFTPHDLRRSFISELLDDGVDLATVARQVGHSNVQTTARYDRRNDDAQKRGVLRMDVPFGK